MGTIIKTSQGYHVRVETKSGSQTKFIINTINKLPADEQYKMSVEYEVNKVFGYGDK